MSPSKPRGKSSPASVRAALLQLLHQQRHHPHRPRSIPPVHVEQRPGQPRQPRARTGSLYLPESVVAAWPGTAVYVFDASRGTLVQAADYVPAGSPVELYEVAELEGVGTWWLATAARDAAPPSWAQPGHGGVVALDATGAIPTSIDGQPVVRPGALWWWVPDGAIGQSPYTPSVVDGGVKGPAPTTPPPPSPVQIQILPDGVRVRFATTGWNLAVDGTVVTLTAS